MCKFNDSLTGGQLHYDWDKVTVTQLNHILTSVTTPCDLDCSACNMCLVAIETPYTTICDTILA